MHSIDRALAGVFRRLAMCLMGLVLSLGLPQTTMAGTTTTTLLPGTPTTSKLGEAVTFKAIVVHAGGVGGPLAGTVSFLDGLKTLKVVALSSDSPLTGTATLVTGELAAGSHQLKAIFSGNQTAIPSVSSPIVYKVNKGATAVSLSSSSPTSRFGRPVRLTATVRPAVGGLPSGQVTFMDGSKTLAKATLTPASPAFLKIEPGFDATCGVTATGSAQCWGTNQYGRLGSAMLDWSTTPVPVATLSSGVVSTSIGLEFNCALMKTGGVKCWGRNDQGQLGVSENSVAWSPVPVNVTGLSTGAVALDLGQRHACVLMNTGRVKCWGANQAGRLGIPEATATSFKPVEVSGLAKPIVAVTVGGYHSCALTSAGGVWCWGDNTSGQLGTPLTTKKSSTPVQVSGLDRGVIAIAAGDVHTCALMATRLVQCWGYNSTGQLGRGFSGQEYSIPEYVKGLSGGIAGIAAGTAHTCVLSKTGGVKCWGDNFYGQVGNDGPQTLNVLAPADVSGLKSGVIAIAAGGGLVTCAVMVTGVPKCWGANYTGQIGDGALVTRQPVPSLVFGFTAAGLSATASVVVSNLSVGTHAIRAIFGGAANHAGSTSPVLKQVISSPAPTVARGNAN